MQSNLHALKLLFLSLFSLLIISCEKQKAILKSVEGYNHNYFRIYEKINGKAKSLSETTYSILSRSGDSVMIKPSYKTFYSYDKDGNEKEVDAYYLNGGLHWKLKNTYNPNATIRQLKYYNNDGELRYTSNYEYDNNGNLACFKDYSGRDSSLISSTIYSRQVPDEVQIVHYSIQNNQTTKLIDKYDQSGNLVEEHFSDGNGGSSITFSYDSLGNEKKLTTHTENGSTNIQINKYRGYDKHGNWLEKFTFVNDTPRSKIERVFDYYE